MPDWRGELRRRLAALRLDAAREDEIVEEMAQHLEARYAELLARGSDAEEARAAALAEVDADALARELGAVVPPAEQPIEPGSGGMLGLTARLAQDVRFGARTLRKHPGFTLLAVLTLALGIGAITAIASAVRGVLLRPLPFADPDRLATFWLTAPEKGLPVVALPNAVFDFDRTHSRAFEAMAAYTTGNVILTGTDDPERVAGAGVTHEFFTVLGVPPLLGQGFLAANETPGAPRMAMLSYALWQRRYGGDSSVIGRTIALSESPVTVAGVMPPGFDFPSHSEAWWTIQIDLTRFNPWYLSTVGRLRTGVTTEEAGREVASLMDDIKARHPERFSGADAGHSRAVAKLLREDLVGDVRTPLLLVLSAVGLVLLIACANVATLLLSRATSRAREMALRCSLGASTRRIGAQLLTESLLLAGLGGTAGLLLATWMVPVLRGLAPAGFPRLELVRLDTPVLLFATGLTLVTGILVGSAPALRGSRVNLTDVLSDGARGSASVTNRRWNDGFVVFQFSVSLLLLVGAGLLLRSFQRLRAVDPGFRVERVVRARISLPGRRYDTTGKMIAFYGQLLEQLNAMPGVAAAGLTQQAPLARGNPQNEFVVEGREPSAGEPVPVADIRNVTPGYFAAIGTPLLLGRAFEASDDSAAPPVAIVDAAMARHYWPSLDPIGKRVRDSQDPSVPWRTVVGVAATVKHAGLDARPSPQIYLPYAQRPQWSMYAVLRARADPTSLIPPLRRIVSALDPNVPVYDATTMENALGQSLGTRRFTDILLAGLAATALLLAAIGIYGVMSLNVTARGREFGIRLALGASPGTVRWQVMRRGLVLAGIGTLLGVAGAAALTRFLRNLLFEVGPLDPLTFGAVVAVLAAVTLAASWVPARRATRTDPIVTLRQE